MIPKTRRDELSSYIVGILKKHDCTPLLVNCLEDHVHILFSLSRTKTIAKVVSEVKTGSAKWMKSNGGDCSYFQWQNGYGAFSVSRSNADKVKDYIANQEEHHKKVSFQEELKKFLDRHQIEYDERYLWD